MFIKSSKKGLWALCFALLLALCLLPIAFSFGNGAGATGVITAKAGNSSDFKTGDGTADDPYLITSKDEFDRIRYHRTAYFLQTADLDIPRMATIGTRSFPFEGFYDGGNFKLTGLTKPIFGFVSGGVVNVHVDSAEITEESYDEAAVGIITNYNVGKIINCFISDSSVSEDHVVGALVGYNLGTDKANV